MCGGSKVEMTFMCKLPLNYGIALRLVFMLSVVSTVPMFFNALTIPRFVMKVEPHSNGPLFTEMHCLLRIGLQRHRDGHEVVIYFKCTSVD